MSQPAFDFGDVELDDATNPTYTVGELADAINDQLRRGFHDGVWVRGEISDLSNRGPHTYFSLVEESEDGKAVLNVQLFAPMKRNLTPILKKNRLELRNGMKVRIFGHLDFWAQGGRLGLKMAGLDPRYTLGEIAQSRDEILRRIVASGLIDRNRRLALSPVPIRVGVATSVDSAAWADFRDELERSGFGFELKVVDTRVQGEFAAAMVAGAVGTLSRRAHDGGLDAIVVIRGGGARNELAVFDAEIIARTIAMSPIPVLTGLGHEIDRSVADEVAHTALNTPTACARALIDRVAHYVGDVEMAWQAIGQRATRRLDDANADVRDLGHRIARRTHAAIDRADERLGQRATQLIALAPATTHRQSERLERTGARVLERAGDLAGREGDRLDVLSARVAALDPSVQLARGWSITRTSDGRVARSVADIAPGESITTTIADGEFESVVGPTITRSVGGDLGESGEQ
jgi:exodeoxyribonuclease VII large subunit